MKCVICGSRVIRNYELLKQAILESGFEITEVISGGAIGADSLGERWAEENNIKLTRMPANWGTYGKHAGFIRNREMVRYAAPDGSVIALWDGESRGTEHTIGLARDHKLKLFIKKS
jgi:hypothetical protein